MSTKSPALFPELFGNAPHLVRGFLNSALQLRDLQSLYAEARERYPDLELSQKLLKVLNVEFEITDQDLARFPQSGPLLVVANHPFGILDGMLLDSVLLKARPDIKILTNSLLCTIEELRDRCLPIDVFGGEGAVEKNIQCLRKALKVLRRGNGLAFFPAGEVSHWRNEYRCITDPPWSTIAVRCATLADVPVLPLYFQGENSLGFQIAGLIHPRLRTARLPGELLNKRNRRVEVRVGSLINPSELRKFPTLEKANEYLRARTYILAHRKARPQRASLKDVLHLPVFTGPKSMPVAPASRVPDLTEEISSLAPTVLVENEDYAVYRAVGSSIPALVQEIGRLREITFRAAGEGTGKPFDLDQFDPYYEHLILWQKNLRQIVGSYRIACTTDVLPRFGVSGLYTSTLFRFQPAFFSQLGSAFELGRSFVRPEFQKEYAPLLFLWQGIARVVAERPDAPVLFGAVSISDEYSEASRELIVQFVSRHSFRRDLAPLAIPRHPFRSRLTNGFAISTISQCLPDLEALSGPIADVGDGSGVPVLLRQYFKFGGRVAGFSLDRHFSNTLDGLLIVDLRQTSPKMLDRYMGVETAARFRSRIQAHLPAC